jgi:hypothetical protein
MNVKNKLSACTFSCKPLCLKREADVPFAPLYRIQNLWNSIAVKGCRYFFYSFGQSFAVTLMFHSRPLDMAAFDKLDEPT